MNVDVLCKEYVDNKKSISEIANEYNTYPNRIRRLLIDAGVQMRSKSEAQRVALEKGTSVHPTKDKVMSDETKSKIGKKNAEAWENKTEDELKAFKDKARENWSKKTSAERENMATLAGKGLYNASRNGSKAEHHVCAELVKAGYQPQPHRKDIGGLYEVDIYLPNHQIAIEIDGPHHFIPVFGETKLQKNIRFDSVKNGILLSKGISIIRVKYLKKHASKTLLNNLWAAIKAEIDKIVPGKTQLIEIEV